MRGSHRARSILVTALFVAGATGAAPASADTIPPIVETTLTVSPNPAVEGSDVVYTGDIVPLNGTVPTLRVHLERQGISDCTPMPACSIDIHGVAQWDFTNLSAPVTITATGPAPQGGIVSLFIDTDGIVCFGGTCPATARHVLAMPQIWLSYSSTDTPIKSGSTVHFELATSSDAGGEVATMSVELPVGFADPTNLSAGATWFAPSRQVELNGNVGDTLSFDAQVTAGTGTTLSVFSALFPFVSPHASETSKIVVGTTRPVVDTFRYFGATRYATSAEISRQTLSVDARAAFIATGANFPDALVAGPVGYQLSGPILLVSRDSIPSAVATELARLQPARIYVLGGTSVVSESVRSALASYSANPVTRIAGANRYETGAAVVLEAFDHYTGPVFLATGQNFPDALGGGSAAAQFNAPMLLTTRDSLPADSQVAIDNDMSPTAFVLLGGTGVLSGTLAHQLQTLYPGVPIDRWSGSDRDATSAALAAHAFPSGADTVYLAIGTNYPDALSGGPSAAVAPGPILLAQKTCLPASVYDELQALAPERVVVLGGTGVIADSAPTTKCAA